MTNSNRKIAEMPQDEIQKIIEMAACQASTETIESHVPDEDQTPASKVSGDKTRHHAKAGFVMKPKLRLEGVGEREIDGMTLVDWVLDRKVIRSTWDPGEGGDVEAKWRKHRAQMEWGQMIFGLKDILINGAESEYRWLSEFLNRKATDWTKLDDRRQAIEAEKGCNLERAEIAKQLEDCEYQMREITMRAVYQISAYFSHLENVAGIAFRATNSRIKPRSPAR